MRIVGNGCTWLGVLAGLQSRGSVLPKKYDLKMKGETTCFGENEVNDLKIQQFQVNKILTSLILLPGHPWCRYCEKWQRFDEAQVAKLQQQLASRADNPGVCKSFGWR